MATERPIPVGESVICITLRLQNQHTIGRFLERLIECTAVVYHLHYRSSVHRFERDTYHGDALPTELRGVVQATFRPTGAPVALRATRAYTIRKQVCDPLPRRTRM
jgi:hypothetical protein